MGQDSAKWVPAPEYAFPFVVTDGLNYIASDWFDYQKVELHVPMECLSRVIECLSRVIFTARRETSSLIESGIFKIQERDLSVTEMDGSFFN